MRQRRQGAGDGGGGGGGDLPYGGYGGGAGDGGYGAGGGGYGGGGYGGYSGGGGGTGAGAGYGGADTPPRGAYGGYGAAPAPAAAAPPRKKSSSSGGGAGGGFKVLLLAAGSFFVLGLTLLSLRYRSQLNSARRDLERTAVTVSDFEDGVAKLESRLRQMESRAREANDRARTAEREAKECRREAERRWAAGGVAASGDREELRDSREEVRRLQGLLEEAKTAGGGTAKEEDDHREDEMEELRERAGELEKRATVLKEHIARESYRSALERFGPGPHDVSIRVELPPDSAYPTIPANPTFTVRLHPLSKMPHAVHLFLEQVAHGLWDGCSFIINADHILQAGAHPGTETGGKGESPDDKMRRFEETKLDVLSYQEYHEDFPHEKFTVGFAGRPGGPDFYINKMDNTRNHGPHGQRHEILSEEADPCFGYILEEGRDVVDRLGLLPRDDSVDPPVLNEPLHILEAKILGAEDVPPPRWTVGKDWTAVERGQGEGTTTTTGTTTGTTTKGTTTTGTTTTTVDGGGDGGDGGSDGKEENSPPGD